MTARNPARKGKLTRQQVAVMRLSTRAGRQLAEEHPEIADDYRHGATHEHIAQAYRIAETYDLHSETNAMAVVRCALRELISEEERSEVANEHWQRHGQNIYEQGRGIHAQTPEQKAEARKAGGLRVYELGVGVCALTTEQKATAGRKGGKKGGRTVYERGLGIYALTPAQKLQASKKGAMGIGRMPWSDEEKKYFADLCNDPAYQHGPGTYRGSPDYETIVGELYRKFGIKRTVISLQHIRRKQKADSADCG